MSNAASRTPSPENLKPTYYGTPDTNAANPCNPTGQTNLNENWSVNCCFGLDGDDLYDMADPDCAGPSSTPGEAGATAPVLVTGYDKTTGALTISYGTGCSATNNNVEYGPLSSVSMYGYSGQVCNIGNTGTATFTLPSSSTFFLLPGHDATKEGSYGKKRTGGTLTERPEDTTSASCPFPQDLTLRCD